MRFLGGALVWGVLASAAAAAPGQCMVTGYGTFDCEVAVDGGGVTFGLPDGGAFVFAQVEAGAGFGYRIEPGAGPGERPEELGAFEPVEGEAGCWANDDEDYRFCVLVEE